MPSRKVADAHILFSAEGLASLEKGAKGSIDRILGMLRGAESATSEGPFSKGLLRDISLMKDMNRAVAGLIAQQRQLHRGSSGPSAASNVRNAMASDREGRLARTRAFSSHQLSGQSQTAAAVSPSLLSANRGAVQSQKKTILEMQRSLADFGVNSPGLSIQEGAGFNKSKGTANFIAENIKDVGVGGTSDSMRAAAQEFRDILDNVVMPDVKDESSKELNSFISKIRMMATELDKTAQSTDEYNEALQLSRKLTSSQKSGARGNLRDIDQGEQRVAASLRRQEGRDFLAADPSVLMDRRIGEIQSNKNLSDVGKAQEITLAAQEIAGALRKAATGVREAGIDKAMELAARKLASGSISPEQFRNDVARSEAGRKGLTSAEDTLRNADFRSRNEGQTEGDVSQVAELEALRKRSAEIQNLIDNNKSLTAEEKKRLVAEKRLLESSVTIKDAEFKLSKEMKVHEDKIRGLTASRASLAVKEAKGVSLTKAEKVQLKSLNDQLDREYAALNKLKTVHSGVNEKLHAGAQSSRRYNFMLQQASYGVQDFVQVIGQTGLSGALRASANNMASLAAATGTTGGAMVGALGTIAMIGMADALKGMGGEAETATEKLERLLGVVRRFSDVRSEMRSFGSELVSERLGSGDFSAGPGRSARDEAAKLIGESEESANELRTIIDKIGADLESGSMRRIARGVESNPNDLGRGMIPVGSIVDPLKDLAAARITDNPAFEAIKRSSVTGARSELSQNAVLNQQGVITDAEMEIYRKDFDDFMAKVKMISSADQSDVSQMAEVAKVIGSTDELNESLKKYNESVSDQVIAAQQSEQSLKRLNESLDTLESDVAASSAFGDQAARDAVQGLESALNESARRIRIRTEDSKGLSGSSFVENEALKKSEQDEYDAYLESLLEISGSLLNGVDASNSVAKSLRDIDAKFSAARDKLERSLELADPEKRAEILAAHDAVATNESARASLVEVDAFSGNAKKLFGETQEMANDRLIAELEKIINNPDASIQSRTAAGLMQERVREEVPLDYTSFERKFAELVRGTEIGSADQKIEGMDRLTDALERTSVNFSGRTERKFGENQLEANDRMRLTLRSPAMNTPENQAAIAEILKKMDEFEADFMKIGPDRSGISGTLAGRLGTFEDRRDKREEVLGSDAQFDKENISDIMRQMSDSIMSFSGNVERKLGETQDEANEREKKRLDDLIAQVTASEDTDDDSLIPFFELTKRKIDDSDSRDLQADTGTTSIEGLHSVIQNSLTGDTKEFDLQKEQRDLLQQISNGINKNNPDMTSNVQTDASSETAQANDESLKFQQQSSETLKEMLTLLKTRADSGGLVIV